ncbi:hypothetical protein ACFWAN_29920 [Streptomyces mirabilis]
MRSRSSPDSTRSPQANCACSCSMVRGPISALVTALATVHTGTR